MSISSLRGIVSRVMPTRKPQAPTIKAARIDYAKIAQAAEDKARTFQHGKGKNTARERLAQLLDADSFVEIGQFAGGNPADGFLGAAVVTGFGEIGGRQVAVYAQDFSIRGGTLGRAEGQKIIALLDKAMMMKIPVISMLDSGGARIQEGVVALGQYGRIFKKTCEASGLIPQISMILGPCAGGAVYAPALTDFIVMTKENSHMFVTGPDVVKAVTGETVSMNDLGGGELHNFQSGVAHYLADDETDAIDYVRSLLSYLPSHAGEPAPKYDYAPSVEDEKAAAEVKALVPEESRQPYDIIEVIEHLVDYGEFVEVQQGFAESIVIGFACINGIAVGIVADQPNHNAGTLDVDASEKAARFVRCCDAYNIPIVTLVDVPGYRPGTEQEESGIIRRGAKLIFAYANATTPMVTVILRKAYGGAYIVMGSKSIGADFAFAWPDAEIAVMGAEGAVNILKRREIAAAGPNEKDMAEARTRLAAEYQATHINPSLSIENGELDGIIDPALTRQTIAESLEVLRTKDRSYPGPKRHSNGPL